MNKNMSFHGDPFGSTFAHKINLDLTHSANTRSHFVGYSKAKDGEESPDKDFVLLQQIRRVYVPYLFDGRALMIEVFKRPDKTYSWEHAHLILTLYRDEYHLNSMLDVSNVVIEGLNKEYEGMMNGELFSERNRSRFTGTNYENILRGYLKNRSFKTPDELLKFCTARKAEGKPRDLLAKFWQDYTQKHFAETPEDATDEIGKVERITNGLVTQFSIRKSS
jgi:hypothetical protein